MGKPHVLIFRHEILRWSETFILAQAENLQRFTPIYCGLRRVPGLETDPKRTIIIQDSAKPGWAIGQLFRLLCWSPLLINKLRQLDIRLIHAHFEGGGMVMTRLARSLGVPLLVTFHGMDITKEDRFQWPNPIIRRSWLARRAELQRHGDLFLGVSSYIYGRMIDRGYPVAKSMVHYTGVDVGSIKPNHSADREPVILFAARLVEKKGCRFLLESMHKVQVMAPELQLVVVGDGPLRENLESESRRVGLNARFLGQCGREVVLKWMQQSRMLCTPFIMAADGDADGCPTVLLEAQAAGLPVVAFDHGGSVEAVDNGRSGLLVSTGKVGELASAILRLHKDDELWKQLSFSGRNFVENRFDLRKQNTRLEELYTEAIRRHIGPRS